MPRSAFSTLALVLFLSTCATAQISTGTIDYLEHREFPVWDGMSIEQKKRVERMKAEGAFDRTGRLTFRSDAFSYAQLPQTDNGSGGRGYWGGETENPDVYYTSIADSIVTDQRQIGLPA